MKCDETRPACLRCTSVGHVCDGYYHVQPSPSSPTDMLPIVPIVTDPPFDLDTSPESKRSFAFFVQRTCPQLGGFFGSDFWERLVLQAAYHEPAIRHAAIAIGSLHELVHYQTAMVPGSDAKKTFALEQYNLAIRDLLLPLFRSGERGVDVCLISCILFTCFEVCPVFHMLLLSCCLPLIQAGCLRICTGTMPQQSLKSEVARSYCVKLCMTSGKEYFNTKCLDRKESWIHMLHWMSLLESLRDWTHKLQG